MKNKQIKIFAIFTIVLFLLNCFVEPVKAYTETELSGMMMEDNPATIYGLNNPIYERMLVHSSGRIVIVGAQETTYVNLQIGVYSSTGNELSFKTINFGSSRCGNPTIFEYDSVSVIIAMEGKTGGATWIKYNIFGYTYTYATTDIDGGGNVYKATQIFEYGIDYYRIVITSLSTKELYVEKYIYASTVTTSMATGYDIATTNTTSYQSPIAFQSPINLKYIYFSCAVVYPPIPTYYCADLSSGIITLLGADPFAGGYTSVADGNYYPYNNYRTFVGASVIAEGTHFYMYFAWIYPDISTSGYAQTICRQTILDFNNTINSGGLLAVARRYYVYTDRSLSVRTKPQINYGYFLQEPTTPATSSTIRMFACDEYSGKHITAIELECNNWHDTGTSLFDTVMTTYGVDNADFTFVSTGRQIAKNPMYGYSYQMEDNIHSYFYSGENVLEYNYSESMSYAPVDAPLIKGKQYTFTWIIYRNGISDSSEQKYKFFFDGLEQKSGTIDTNGKIIVSITVNLTGSHVVNINTYDNITSTLIYTGIDYTYTWVESIHGPTDYNPTDIMANWYIMLVVWVPIGFVVVLPSLAFALLGSKFSAIGMIVGLLFGGFIGVIGGTMLNILPTYVLYLYILLMGICFAMIIKGGGNG